MVSGRRVLRRYSIVYDISGERRRHIQATRSASHHETKLKILALTDGMLCTPSQRTDFRRSPGPDPFCDHCGVTVLQRFSLQASSFKAQ